MDLIIPDHEIEPLTKKDLENLVNSKNSTKFTLS